MLQSLIQKGFGAFYLYKKQVIFSQQAVGLVKFFAKNGGKKSSIIYTKVVFSYKSRKNIVH